MIVGSNVFNVAAMVGLSALLAGNVRVRRGTLIVEGSVALAVTAVVVALLAGGLSAVVSVVLLGCVLIPSCWWSLALRCDPPRGVFAPRG